MTLSIPNFKSDKFYNLRDNWIETAPNELTHYHDKGKGLPLLFLHGSGMGASARLSWWLNLPALSKKMRTIAFDLIGYGETVCAPNTEFGIKQWGSHTIRLMDALNIDKAWLIGGSLGGWVAMQLAIDYPDRFYGAVSVGTGGAKKRLNAKITPKNIKNIRISKALIRKDLLKNIQDDDIVCDALVNLRYQAAKKEAAKGLRPVLLQARDYDRKGLPLDSIALSQISIPVLLVHGMNDKVVPLARSIKLLNAVPIADAHMYSECGHWPHISKADQFNSLVKNFIKNHTK